MFNWLSKFFKKEKSTPQPEVKETPVNQFPRSAYTHYWEVIPGWDTDLQEHTATVRFYSYTKGFETSSVFHSKDWNTIQEQINSLLKTQMPNYKR
jgi:hypothetical protein